jgi:hypothetical protein
VDFAIDDVNFLVIGRGGVLGGELWREEEGDGEEEEGFHLEVGESSWARWVFGGAIFTAEILKDPAEKTRKEQESGGIDTSPLISPVEAEREDERQTLNVEHSTLKWGKEPPNSGTKKTSI